MLTDKKYKALEKLSDERGIFSALAFDQRGALKRLMSQFQTKEPTREQMEELKVLVSKELTPYASSMLLDPEYGLPASQVLDASAGLLLAYERTGYDTTSTKRLPDCLEDWSVMRLKQAGADAIKFLLYYDVDGDASVNRQKQAYIERIGSECRAEDIPFFLEILAYDEKLENSSSLDYARLKPKKVIEAMRLFSNPNFGVDVLKVEVPVDMKLVEGYTEDGIEALYSVEEAKALFKEQDGATHLPYIYLSAGVSAELFQKTLQFAKDAGSKFNGVLCGRATWSGSVKDYIEEGPEAAVAWLKTKGYQNIQSLNEVLKETATSWKEKNF
ncbi:tagatose-bisphosphate aldolase [Streptococcus himalayensis]|uniref:Tagatose 1,6-diphosphate aldolase n=1 Tax=Streptococcus himalayensis TaxID=1888195 RepID=A0A917A4B4_9STRE|nr:tagatose-bisphosphate aldolase [Streptococcus himalayensis]GGE26038.1 tagatose 1,6-diphosphate aldolase 1 [Streptococcus himalayensis]